jgi:hypothetical protein
MARGALGLFQRRAEGATTGTDAADAGIANAIARIAILKVCR